jgi:hypothetical protein
MEFSLIFFWLFFAVLVGVLAQKRGRMGFGWFILAVMFSPLLIGLLVLVLGDAAGSKASGAGGAPTPETHVRCPDCRELVFMDARKCKHCGTALVPPEKPLPKLSGAYHVGVGAGRVVSSILGKDHAPPQ